MKKLSSLIALLIALNSVAFARTHAHHEVQVLSTRMDIFYFKVCEAFIGASIEVYDEAGTLIMNERITSQKSIVDFYEEVPGHYTIKIKKGDQTEEFGYYKSSAAPLSDSAEHHLLLTAK